jgi:hypothetical protein
MGIFGFVSWALVTIAAVTLPWPVNIPLMALAFKVRNGQAPVDFEPREFWIRSTIAAAGPAGMSVVLLVLAYVLAEGFGFPPGPAQLILLMAYVPAAVGYVFWAYALEDLLQGLSVFAIYVLLTGLPLLLIGRLTGLWATVERYAPWLWSTTERVFT